MLSQFITKGDTTATIIEVFKEDERPRHIGQLKTPDGQVQTFASDFANDFSEQASYFITQYEQLHQTLAQNSKKIHQRSVEIAQLMDSSSHACTKMADLLEYQIKNETGANLYRKLSGFHFDMSERQLKIGATLNEYLNSSIEYQA